MAITRSIERSPVAAAILVVLVATLVYAGALGNGFVFDDRDLIEKNPMVTEAGHLSGIFASHYWHPLRPRGYLYRPLTILSLRADHLLGGGRPWSFHATNVLLHAAVCLVALAALRRVLGEGKAPVIGALLFAVHPIHAEAVAGIAGRADLLAALFALAAWRLHLSERPALCALAFGAGLLSKESAVALPGILLASDLLLRQAPSWRDRLRPAPRRYGAALAALALYLGLRWLVLGAPGGGDPSLIHPMDNPLAAAPALVRAATAVKVFALQAWLLVFPLALSSDYSFDQIPAVSGPFDPWFLIGSILIAGALGAAWTLRRHRDGPSFPILFHFVCLAPVSNVIVPIGTIMAERILYLPSLGFCAGLALALAPPVSRGRLARLALGGAAAALVALGGARTAARVADWKDNLTLFASAARVSPRSVKVQYNLGMELLKRGDAAAALPWLERAVETGRGLPGRAETMRDLAVALTKLGRHDEALGWLERAHALDPAHAGILVNLGNAWLALGRHDRALSTYEEALRIRPDHSGARLNRASLLLKSGRAREAVAELERVARESPRMAEAWYLLAGVYEAEGRRDESARALREFIAAAGPEQEDRIAEARARLAAIGG